MNSRLLLINCSSPYFVHIPMGTFGLCDYLKQRDLPAKMLNLALYDDTKRPMKLDQCLDQFRPTHVGLVFHWQETVEGVFWTGKHIQARNEDIQIVCGGFTAGYFGVLIGDTFISIRPIPS